MLFYRYSSRISRTTRTTVSELNCVSCSERQRTLSLLFCFYIGMFLFLSYVFLYKLVSVSYWIKDSWIWPTFLCITAWILSIWSPNSFNAFLFLYVSTLKENSMVSSHSQSSNYVPRYLPNDSNALIDERLLLLWWLSHLIVEMSYPWPRLNLLILHLVNVVLFSALFLNQVILGLLPWDAVLPIGVLLEILGLAPIHASFQIPLVSGGFKAMIFLPSIYLIHVL